MSPGQEKAKDKTLSPARRRLRERAEEMRYSLRELSLLIERNATYLTQFVNKGSPRELTERDRQRLAFLLKTTPQDLTDEGTAPPPPAAAAPPTEAPATEAPATQALATLAPVVQEAGVPVLSVALIGDAIGRIPAHQAVETVDRPAALRGVRTGYAVRIPGNSFYPAFRPGDMVFVHPQIPPLPGDLVCVTTPDGRLLLGRLAPHAVVLSFAGFENRDLPQATVEKVAAVVYR